MTSDTPIMFSNNPLDRAGHLRNDPEWLQAQRDSENSLFVPFWHQQPLVLPPISADEGPDIGWLPASAMGSLLAQEGRPVIFLGLNRRQKALFAVDISDLADPENTGPFANMGQFEDLRALAARGDMSDGDLAIMAQAKALLDWHQRHGFCAQCGGQTILLEAGYKRQCTSCHAEHFPRTDPVVIMLTIDKDGERCLVGRQPGWPSKMYSALAGFVEPGETIEQAVAREMMEEAGIDVEDVRYVATQPWPFPASLMIGCTARARTTEITIDGQELEDAKWISREDIKQSLDGNGTISVPPSMAIAHQLLVHYIKNM